MFSNGKVSKYRSIFPTFLEALRELATLGPNSHQALATIQLARGTATLLVTAQSPILFPHTSLLYHIYDFLLLLEIPKCDPVLEASHPLSSVFILCH